jgi:predicted alpha/beta hydrolase
VQIHSGVGIPKEFYRAFAQFLAGAGFAAICFDYRGTGGSRSDSLRSCSARLSDWGTLDMTAIADFIGRTYGDAPSFVVGHSMGGQLLGLMANHAQLKAAVLIGAGTGYWRDFLQLEKLRCGLAWHLYLPVASKLLGYYPMSHVGLGQDLPPKVGQQLVEWCRTRDYLEPYRGHSVPRGHWDEIACPLLSIYASDDKMTNRVTARRLLDYYSAAPRRLREVNPSECGRQKLGHFGLFSRKCQATLWPEVAAFLDSHQPKPQQTDS